MAKLESVFIIGGCGGFGRRFSEFFRVQNIPVVTADVVAGADLTLDVAEDPARVKEHLGADLVLLCLDESNTLKVLTAISDYVAASTLVVDICSVKTKVCAAAEQYATAAQYLSLHPMFGPERDIQGSNAVVIPLRKGVQSDAFIALLSAWGLNILETTAEEHDAVTAMVQVVPHALLLGFGEMRASMQTSEALIQAFATPIFKDLDRVSQGLLQENPTLYHNIQTSNPNGDAARVALLEALTTTLETLSDSNPAATLALFERGRRS